MTKDLMLLTGGHPIHVAFGDCIGATNYRISENLSKNQFLPLKIFRLFNNSFNIPSDFDRIICESCYYYPAIKRRMGLLGKTRIINMNSGPLIYHLLSGRIKGSEKKVLTELLKECDGHLVYGEYGKELVERLLQPSLSSATKAKIADKPIGIIYPFIKDSARVKFAKIKPNLDSKSIIIIATSDPFNKGLDLLFKALKLVRESESDVHLNLVTRMGKEEIEKVPDYDGNLVSIMQNVPDIADALSSSSLYIQPSRGDMFPVGCLEAISCGLPTVVSNENGAKEIVQKIDQKMVVNLDPNSPTDSLSASLAESILYYFEKTPSQRKQLSDAFRLASAPFNEKEMLVKFKKELEKLGS
ncbi:glycosyltransferase family 4 protein [Candidatus Micrarchaeota archaeon]|nr:glycosyltransferase family 4 protein [Candidatus Micrarchaeota archaeon]